MSSGNAVARCAGVRWTLVRVYGPFICLCQDFALAGKTEFVYIIGASALPSLYSEIGLTDDSAVNLDDLALVVSAFSR